MIEDASNEFLLLEEEKLIPMKIGNAFIDVPSEQVEDYLSERQEKIKMELDNLGSSMNDVRQQMNQLKILLYAKFKNSINLETD
jgi:prefoldin subunit 4